MAKTAPSALDHVFSPRDLCRRCHVVWVWSILSALLLIPLLVAAGLFLGILADHGHLAVNLSQAEVAQFRDLTGLQAAVQPRLDDGAADAANSPQDKSPDNAEKPAEPSGTLPWVHVNYDESGILPAVWRSRNAWWGSGLAWLFRNVPVLQSNILASMLLLAVGAVVLVVRGACLAALRAAAGQAALEAVAPLRRNVHRQALRLGPEDLDGSGQSTARKVFVDDIDQVRHGLATWIGIDTRFPLELFCLAVVACSIQPLVFAQYLLFVGAVWYYLESQDRHAESERKLATDRADAELQQQAAGFRAARLVRGLGIEQMDHDQFANHLAKYHDLATKQMRAVERADHLSIRDLAAVAMIAVFLLFILATHVLFRQNELSVAGGAVFLASWLLTMPAIMGLRTRSSLRHSANAAVERVQAYLDQIPTVSQAVGARFLEPLSRSLHVDSVSYKSRAGRVLLHQLDLSLDAGRTYSLVSLDPLESLALVLMLPRFIEPQSGRILFDGEDIAWATLESLRAETVFVGADEQLLPGTVLDNIRGGRTDFTLQQAIDAAKLTHAHNFIVKLFDGYETSLPDRADLMDVSQRFRLGLARALIRNPALLIIEEPRVPLDEDTKALLADAYERICRDRTVIFLPGRMSTVRRSDQVIVLHEGRVAAIGPQSRLVAASAVYRHWEYVNFNEFRQHE